jgi:hypothetical protein
MKKIPGLLLAYSLLILAGCKKERITGSGSVITQERPVSNFSGIRSLGAANVFIIQGNVFKVEVKDYENLLPYFETKLNGSILEVGFQSNTKAKNSQAEVFITMPALQSLKTEGSGNIVADGAFNPVNVFNAAIFGSGDISIAHSACNVFNSFIAGSGNIHAFGMQAAEAFTQTEGSGHVEITATSKLNVNIKGSGNVYYKSTPVVTVSIHGSGQVIHQ